MINKIMTFGTQYSMQECQSDLVIGSGKLNLKKYTIIGPAQAPGRQGEARQVQRPPHHLRVHHQGEGRAGQGE